MSDEEIINTLEETGDYGNVSHRGDITIGRSLIVAVRMRHT